MIEGSNERHMQSRESKVVSSKALDASLVVTECGGIKSYEHITSSSSGTYITHAVDANIRPVNNQVPFAEVQLTAQHNVLANEQQHTEQSEPIYDTYLLEKVDSNTTPDSTNMCHKGGEIDQDAEQYKVQSPKTRNNNKPVVPKSHTQKPGRQIAIGQRFSPKIFKIAGLRWIPTGKMFTDNTTKVDSEPSNGSNDDITNSSECDQTLNGFKSDAHNKMMSVHISSGPALQRQNDVCSHQPRSLKEKKSVCFSALYLQKKRNLLVFDHSEEEKPSCFSGSTYLGLYRYSLVQSKMATSYAIFEGAKDTLFCPMFDEYFNPSPSVAQPVLEVAVQDTPSTSISQTIKEAQSHVIPTSIEEDDHGSSEGSGITPEVPNEPKDNFAVVAEKQAGYVQTNLTLSSAELEIQSMVDVPIHQEDLAVQRTPLIDPVISMTFQEEFRSAGWCKENRDGQKTVAEDMGINPLVHSFRALSTLRRFGLRTASAAAKPCQGDSSEFYLITGRIPTVAAAGQRHVNSQPHAHTPYF
ncbi:hypothetical protein Tco_0365646 [Tanacetum coccineum]